MSPFQGIPLAAVDFFAELETNNNRDWWAAHRSVHNEVVKAPIEALAGELEDEFGPIKVYRPNRDVRFSADKTPYKDHQGAYVATEDGIGYYVQVSASGLMVAGGWWSSAPKQLSRYRDAVDSASGVVLEKAIAAAEKGGLTLGGDVMKTRPRGVAEDHPRLDLLRHRSLTVERQDGTPAWVSTRKVLAHVQKTWRAMTPLVEWLTDHVGPEDDGIPPEPR